MFLALALIAIAGGTLFTYLYDEGAPLVSRLSVGACIGFGAFGLLAYVYASFLGLTPLSLTLAAASIALPFILLKEQKRRVALMEDIRITTRDVRHALFHPSLPATTCFLFYAAIALLLWLVYDRAMFEGADGIYTGLANNYGDLPFHLSVITSFVKGGNFPPEDPTYAGASFTYPFLADFIAACFVRAGANLREAMLLENLVLALALTGLLHRWAFVLTGDRLAAHLTPALVFFSGGLGWWLLFDDARLKDEGILAVLARLPQDYTIIPDTIYRWGNALTTLLVPQRGMLLGLPLALIIFIQWWQAFEREHAGGVKVKDGKNRGRKTKSPRPEEVFTATPSFFLFSFFQGVAERRMAAAGLIAGLLPLAHAHTFAVVMMVGATLALIQGTRRWRAWAAFFCVATLLAVPQMWWATSGSSVRAGTFFAWQVGWDRGESGVFWFWLINTGLFIPLLVLALLWRGERAIVQKRLLLFYLPFTLCFLIPNLFKLAPWVWDNIKVLFYWYVASVPIVALLLARLWRGGALWLRLVASTLIIALTLSGALDIWRIVSRATTLQEFDRDGIAFAAMMEKETPRRALVLHAPIHNHPVFLTGRRSLMGYPGHIWTHGLDYQQREAEIKRIYAGTPDAPELLSRNGVEYVVVSPLERVMMPVNNLFFESYQRVGEIGEYRLYKIKRP